MNFSLFKFKSSQKISQAEALKLMNPTNQINKNKAPLENLPGIGRHTPKALAKYGIKTINQFANFTEQEVVALLGKSGLKLLGTAKNLCTSS